MSTTLPLFWNLSSASKKERIDASVKLISALETLQVSFVPKEPSPASEDEEDDEEEVDEHEDSDKAALKREEAKLNFLNAGDVSYSIRRLVRGLASPRESSRLGFSVALTELLSRINTVTCSQILALIIDASTTQGSASGQEDRDVLFARLFGITALIQSGLLTRQQPLPSSGSASTEASSLAGYVDVLSELIDLGEKKSWLRESVWWTLGLAVDSLHGSEAPWREDALSKTLDVVFVDNKTWTPEKLALALKLQKLWPNREWRKLFAPTLKHGQVLHTGNMSALSKILKESAMEEEEDVPKVGGRSWKPQVHYVWDILLDELLPSQESEVTPKGSFQEFFRIVVDESLFASSASIERKYWGFEIFRKALPRVRESDLPMLFTQNFMRTWINHLSNFDRYLHNFAKQIATNIHTVVQKNPAIGFAFIIQLTGVNGNQQFDKLTKTKTVESILATMNVDGIQNYIGHLLKHIDENDEDDIQVTNSRRSWIIEQLAGLIRNHSIPRTDEWLKTVLDWFTVHGMFIVKKKSEKSSFRALHSVISPPLSDVLRKQCRERLLSSLAELTAQASLVKSDDEKTQKVAGAAADGSFWVSKVVGTIEQLGKDSKHVQSLFEFDDAEKAIHEKAREVVTGLHKITGDQQEAAKGAELLLVSSVLQHYAADDSDSRNTESLKACVDGASRLFASPQKTTQKKAHKPITDEENVESVPEPIDVLVDTIIGFMEKATAYMRSVGGQSFSLLSGAVKESTVDLILSQLERRDPAELLADDSSDEMDVDEDESGGRDAGSGDEDGDEDEDEDEDSSSSGSEDDADETGDEDEDPELRRKITEVLRANGIEAATGLSDDEEEEDQMDDEQMMAIDDQLAQIFRERTKGKGKDGNAQREATHFKNRILDLVDIFIKKQPTSPLIIRFITPLVDLTLGSGSDERQLSTKTAGLLKSRVGKLKDAPSSVDKDDVVRVLEELHTRARKVHSLDALATISGCSLYVSKVLLHAGAEEPVLKAYRESLVDFITRKASDLNAKFFNDFIKRNPVVAWNLRGDLITVTTRAVNVYRQIQAYGLLQALVNQLPSIGDRQKEIASFMSSLRQNLHDIISKACDETTLTAAQLKDILKLALLAVRQSKRCLSKPDDLSKIWMPATWIVLTSKLAGNDRFKASTSLQAMCRQIAQLVQAPAAQSKKNKIAVTNTDEVTGKRKAEASGDDVASTKKAKRKKSKTANTS